MSIIRRFFLSFALILLGALAACFRHSQSSAETFPIEQLALYKNVSVLHVDPSFLIAAFSQFPEKSEPLSCLLAYRAENGRWQEVFRKTLPSAYNAHIELRRDLKCLGQPTVILRVQFGAAAETQEVYAIANGSLQLIQTLDAGAFAWCYPSKSNAADLVAIPDAASDQPTYYHWIDDKFQEIHPSAAGVN
jgi:hypothetical protein